MNQRHFKVSENTTNNVMLTSLKASNENASANPTLRQNKDESYASTRFIATDYLQIPVA